VETCLWEYNASITLLWVPEDDLTTDIAGSVLTWDLLFSHTSVQTCVQNSACMTSSFDVMSKNKETAWRKPNHSASTDHPAAVH